MRHSFQHTLCVAFAAVVQHGVAVPCCRKDMLAEYIRRTLHIGRTHRSTPLRSNASFLLRKTSSILAERLIALVLVPGGIGTRGDTFSLNVEGYLIGASSLTSSQSAITLKDCILARDCSKA